MLLPARYDASVTGGKTTTSTHIRAVLKAVLEDGTIVLRPLCSHHDIALALKQLLLESNRFQQAYLQIPKSSEDHSYEILRPYSDTHI